MKIKKVLGGVLAIISLVGIAAAAEKGPTIVVKKDERKIAGLNTNGIPPGICHPRPEIGRAHV